MAKFKLDIPDDFIKRLGSLSEVDEYAPKMIDEALPTLEASFKKNMARVMKNPTGELMNSIKMFHAKPVKYGGFYGYITAIGVAKGKKYNRKRKKGPAKPEGYRNYQKILALEYGTTKQVPTPFIDKAIKDSESAVLAKMQEVFNREVGD